MNTIRNFVRGTCALLAGLLLSAAVQAQSNAAFVSQAVPSMMAGHPYLVTVTMKNTGTTSWTPAGQFGIGSVNPPLNTTWGVSTVLVNRTVLPGQEQTFSFTVTAPSVPGTYNFQWQAGQVGVGFFGQATPAVAVKVAPLTGTITYFHNDAAGTPKVTYNAAGAVLWKENYRPYGERINNQAAATDNNKVWFAGKPQDANTGLSYMGARYYDPLLGRFMGVDPKGFDPGNLHSFNRYAYANNNPYRFVDPDGHSAIDIVFLGFDMAKLGMAMYTGVGVPGAMADVALSAIGVVSPVPGVGEAMKAARVAERSALTARVAERAKNVERAGAESSTLRPGPFAKESIPGHMGKPTAAEQRQVNELMEKNGCHTCGTNNPGTKSNNAIVDHQPPRALEETTQFFPHCIDCMRRQGGETLQELIRKGAN